MKKYIFLLLTFLLFSTNCLALPFNTNKPDTEKPVVQEQYLLITEQANALYAENNISEAQNLLLSIPENQRTAQNWLLLGNILQDQGKIDDAEFMYKKSISCDEKFYKAYYNLGNIYLNANKPNMAVEEYQKVVRIKPDFAYGHYNLSCAYIKLGKYTKAKFELYNALDLKNTEPDFYYNLIYILKQQKKDKEAKKYVETYNKLTGEL